MFSRLFTRDGAYDRTVVRPLSWVMAGVLASGFVQVTAVSSVEAAERPRPGTSPAKKALPKRDPLPVKQRKSDPALAAAAVAPAPVRWPAAGTAEISVPAARTGAAARSAPAAPKASTKIGGLPVTVAAAPTTVPAPGVRAGSTTAPGKVSIQVLERRDAEQAGVDGPVLRVRRADGGTASGAVQLGVDYAGFAHAYGGDFGARLRLVKLPECALSTPQKPECAGTPLRATNDTAAKTVSATAATGSLIALAAADSSSQGNYGATQLAPSSKWSVAPSTGGFSWSYPLRTPPVPGGGAPGISLGYSSQGVDGRMATTNNQGSWIGEGFGYEPGYIERRYKACSDDGHDQYADQCWAYDNATIMLNGKSTDLVKTGSTWKLADDDGSKIERLKDTTRNNGDDDGEHWKVTTANGTEYYFGLNRLPGWTSGKEETRSAWTVPIYGDDSGEPCYNATFTSAFCDQGWRWNLDYVKDRFGNVSSYYYQQELNYYARGKKTDVNGVPYVRGGWLKRIDYGQRHNAVYTTNAPARVRFDVKERCLPAGPDCDPEDLIPATASRWPDVPFDRNCAANVKCKPDQIMPTFWTRARLNAVVTEIRGATAWTPVDEWKLEHLFTDNGDGSRTLWLHKILHKGLAGGSIEQPAVTLGGLQLPNRIDRDGDFIAPLVRFRLATVYTDTGAQIDVNYAPPDCTQTSLPTPGRSTKRCYPVKWAPLGSGDPITDWFHKYVVAAVIETDRTGGAPDMVTKYQYLDGAAWRHAEPDGIGDTKDDTWSDWRGYGRVVVTAGDGQTQTTKTEYRYLRGMHGDKDPDGGTRTVTVTDSTGGTHTDRDEVSGHELESIVYDGSNILSKKITTPWRHNTATESFSWGSKKAWFINTATSRSLVALKAGGWRETAQSSTYETTYGRATQSENEGDVAVTGDESCTRTSYVDNPGGFPHSLVSRVESVAVGCSVNPDRRTQVISDTRTLYDGKTFGAAPTLGSPTRTERLASHNGTTGTYVRASEGTFDSYGRPLTATDALGSTTKNVYTETNGLTTQLKETNPLGFVTTTKYAPAWGSPVSQTDQNNLLSELEYDALGRLTKVWMPDRSGSPGLSPSIRYTYLIRTDKPVAVKTERRQNDGSYSVEYKLHDGHLRPRQIQSEAPDGNRNIADTFYTATGKLAKTYATYTAEGAPGDAIYPAVNGDVDGQTLFVYDGADRVKAEITAVAGNEKWRTSTTYGGDRTSVDPPSGATPTTTITNALGQTTQLLQYKGEGPSGAFDKTEYSYTSKGQLSTVKDPAGNVWKSEYDQLGRKVTSTDPDSGRSTMTYDDLDRLTSTTNSLNTTISTTYDQIGRKTAIYKGAAGTGQLLSSWTYDQEMLGYATSASRWIDGAEYATYYTIYDEFYRPHLTTYQVPDHAGAELAGTYLVGTEYNRDGTVQSLLMPEGGGLNYETIVYKYDGLERLIGTSGDAAYLTNIDYASTGEVLQTETAVGGKKIWSTYEYEQGTKRLTRQRLDRQAAPIVDVDARYTYDPSGNIRRIANNPSGTRDVQCFTYDYLRRMDKAWTSASTADDPCAGGPTTTGVGGVAPYHHEYTFDTVGNRKTEKQYATDGTSLIERSYQYPAAGAAQPHTLSSMTEKTPSGEKLHEYGYDATGNTTRRAKAGEGQTLAWDAEGNLESVTDAAGKKTSFLYDVDGSRMLRKEPNHTTLYLPGMEIRLDHQTKALEPTRYYALPGGASLVRKKDGLHYVANDHHGTGTATVDATGAITHRRTTPYGETRGTPPVQGAWPTEKGFVGGNQDSTTGLVNIGAREYDTVTGRFISIDPIIDVNDPQQMNGYAYANNNPISFSDPDGLKLCSDDACGPGADFVDTTGKYHNVPGHNDGRRGESGQYDPSTPGVNESQNPRASPKARADAAAAEAAKERQARIAQAKQMILDAAKALGKIVADELGITDALDCFTKGDMGGCVSTAVNVLSSVVGGAIGKLAVRYGAPWKWEKFAALVSRTKGLLGKLVDGVKRFFKASKCHSFAAGTLVLMADGTKKPIEKVKPKDKVLATDPVTGKTKVRAVLATYINLDTEFTDLTVTAGGRSSQLQTTTNHPFWSNSRRAWVNAAQLRAEESLRTSAGGSLTILAVSPPYTSAKLMYDLTVAFTHTYYVIAGSTPVLVHNCDTTDLYRVSPVGRGSSELDHGLDPRNHPLDLDEGLDGSAYFGNKARVEDYASQHRDSHGQGFKVGVPTKWLRRNNIEPMEDFLNEGAVEYAIPSHLFDEFNTFPRTPWKPGGA
ncbi:polymorphic toxin-type HINT domain-containing protein [Actinoplanes sp. NPDC051346]|uniref:polymorphic toxin-type HINT domain-containing protein n=1 Tax=Actinoplanes sp. NPDC051346 TaxID=3155048 RepID=UPI0034450940